MPPDPLPIQQEPTFPSLWPPIENREVYFLVFFLPLRRVAAGAKLFNGLWHGRVSQPGTKSRVAKLPFWENKFSRGHLVSENFQLCLKKLGSSCHYWHIHLTFLFPFPMHRNFRSKSTGSPEPLQAGTSDQSTDRLSDRWRSPHGGPWRTPIRISCSPRTEEGCVVRQGRRARTKTPKAEDKL